jgi:hypothetical protein
LQYFASVSGGRIIKGRFPIIDPGDGVQVGTPAPGQTEVDATGAKWPAMAAATPNMMNMSTAAQAAQWVTTSEPTTTPNSTSAFGEASAPETNASAVEP